MAKVYSIEGVVPVIHPEAFVHPTAVLIGEDAMVAACAFVSAGTVVEPRTLVGGIPAKTLRALKDSEIDWKRRGTAEYQELTRRCLASFAEAQPLSEREPDRPKVLAGDYKPLAQSRKP
jgi:phenylacetic acid degradation protein